jgi:ubiquinone/menaquinone biosynthesis C-methylase UbiE
MIERVLEPEVMGTEEDAREYDSMDHAAVNAVFVDDLLSVLGDGPCVVLDLGAGTAQIPIELCRRAPRVRVVAVDAAESMLAIGARNVTAAGLVDRIEFVLADAKGLPFPGGSFDVVASNSIVHHIADPASVMKEAVRVAASGALQFHRDLCRPNDDAELERLVAKYAGDATPYQRKLFADSLRAALTVEEMRDLISGLGFARETVQMTSDRHWTWIANLDS